MSVRGLGRYEYHDSRSAKYWEITETTSGYFTVCWGKIGTRGQVGARELNSKEAEKKINEKLAKGYELTRGSILIMDKKPEPKETSRSYREGFASAFEEMYAEPKKEKVAKKVAFSKGKVSEEFEVCIPSRCTAKLPENLEQEKLISEVKLDGSRYVLYMGCNPYARKAFNSSPLLSRRASSYDGLFTDRSGNVPHITNFEWDSFNLTGTVLDGEAYHSSGEFVKCNSIMNSTPDKAIQKQDADEKLHYVVFDIMFFKGQDVRGRPWHERRKLLEYVCKTVDNEFMYPVEYRETNLVEHFQEIVDNGGEGIIIKNKNLGYGQGWAKLKARYDVSCIITGFTEGQGKYKGSFGALKISVMNDDGKLQEVATCSGMNDETRQQIHDNRDWFMHQAVDVFAQSISKAERLRHPIFHRVRGDIDETTITMEKLKSDLKHKLSSKIFA
jgi:ATP-dependent DNA ligase